MTPWELQKAIYSRLKGFSGLTNLARVTDHVSQKEVFPYVRIGEYTAVTFDTHSSSGSDNTVTVHSWSQHRGQKEIKKIMRQIYLALHRFALVVEGGVDMIDCQWDSADTFLDEDGLTRHGVQRFRILLDEG